MKLTPPTTAQSLGSLLKSARDIMRKDKGLNGDLDRLPLLTWIMFLKFLDDLEHQRADEASLAGTKFKPAIEAPYRWRDWAARADGITGDELLAFINHEEATRPDGTRGPGLFAYLRKLTSSNGDDRRDVIATVFKGVDNRMKSGYILRDVVNKVAGIHFTAADELHTLGALYESMLREMRDAAGDSGEFYTPRAVVRLMVAVSDPRLGETVLDPASGTGGFLVEAFTHLGQQVKTVAHRQVLQGRSVLGCEPKGLPYLLCQMNLLLHGLDSPQIDPGNALRHKLTEIGEKERVDVILTNPPFGGEEERGIQGNFPEDKQTAETALLFLQLIMRKLRRQPTPAGRPARAAVVVPNGMLSADGVAARIKHELLRDFNLHTIVRLPNGVFSPYTDIPSNILFFERGGSTGEIWYYELKLPVGRRGYTKTMPLRFEEFTDCLKWWHDRVEDDRAWRFAASDALRLDSSGSVIACNLDTSNPRAAEALERVPPDCLLTRMKTRGRENAELLQQVSELTEELCTLLVDGRDTSYIPLLELVTPRTPDTVVSPTETYAFAGVYSFGRGVFRSVIKTGADFAYKQLTKLRAGEFTYPKLMAWEGAFGIVPPECDGCYVSPEFPVFTVNSEKVLPEILELYFRMPSVWPRIAGASAGTNARRRRLHPTTLLAHRFPLPTIEKQIGLRDLKFRLAALRAGYANQRADIDALLPGILDRAFVVPAGLTV